MKFAVIAVAALLSGGPNWEKMVGEANVTLGDVVERGLKEAKSGTPLKVCLESEKGKTIFCMEIAHGKKILELHYNVNGALVKRETEDEDGTTAATAFKTSMKQAIDLAVAKAQGKAVTAHLTLRGPRSEIIVRVWKSGKLIEAAVDSQKPEITYVGAPRRPGFLGIGGAMTEGGIRITELAKDGPAMKAGLRKDDILISVDGTKAMSLEQLSSLVRRNYAGEMTKIEFRRGDKTGELAVILGHQEEDDDDDDDDEEDGDDD